MCGFGVSNVLKLESVNKFCQKRGPDNTNITVINNIQFLHNLLHITGVYTKQPFHKEEIVAIFNGEIYNYKSFGQYSTDGECLIDLYNEYGTEFSKHLDGEFAICLIDFKKKLLVISTDVFACKPLWYQLESNRFCIASYESQLSGLGFSHGKKLEANTTIVFNLSSLEIVKKFSNVKFNLEQYKNSYDDWLLAFSKSIKKRTANTNAGMFVGMSSGFDSGAIACELNKQNVLFKCYSITNNENIDVLKQRLDKIKNKLSFTLSEDEFYKWKTEIDNNCEDFFYDDGKRKYNIKKDQASMGLSAICKKANEDNLKIYFSGHGADEIISDYGFGGEKIYKHSGFGGLFPEKLEGFFPWHSFWDGTQIQYLNKEEYVAGHFGIETRYPFLDKNLVQEFLWLNVNLKNKKYKSCLAEYLEINNFPFENGEKRGFHVTEKGKKTKKIKK